MSYISPQIPIFTTQIGLPSITPPPSPKAGDVVIQTSDGTANTPVQSVWTFDGLRWIQTGGSVIGATATAPTPGIRQYAISNTALQEQWVTATAVSAASITAYGFIPVGAGVTIAAYIGGGLFAGRSIVALNCPRTANGASPGLDVDVFTPPTKYLSHTLQASANVDQTYYLETLTDRVSIADVWICNATTGVPELRLKAAAITGSYAGRHTPLDNSPLGEGGSSSSYYQWLGFPIPKSALVGRLTPTNQVKLAIRPGMFNGENGLLYVSGYGISASPIGLSLTSPYALDNRVNGGGFLSVAGMLDGIGYIAIAANATVPTPANGGFINIPLTGTDRDIWLTFIGHGNANGNPSQWISVTLKHTSGDIVLGRPRPNLQSPYAVQYISDIGNGHPMSGFVIPAATLAAKAVTPANSAIPYLQLQLRNTNGNDVAYFSGIVCETLT
jgi:hypothetical protein